MKSIKNHIIKSKNQTGFSLMALIGVFALLGLITIYGTQIISGYIDKHILKNSIAQILLEEKSNLLWDSDKIRDNILKVASVNNIELKNQDINIEVVSNDITVKVDFYKIIKITENIYIVIDLYLTSSSP